MGKVSTLPQFQSGDQNLQLMQNSWAAVLNPVLRNAFINGIVVDAALIIGDNVINHRLGRQPQGWTLVDIDASSSVYRSAPFNASTLTLNSSAIANASIYVF